MVQKIKISHNFAVQSRVWIILDIEHFVKNVSVCILHAHFHVFIEQTMQTFKLLCHIKNTHQFWDCFLMWTMLHTKELLESQLRAVDLHKFGKGYSSIFKKPWCSSVHDKTNFNKWRKLSTVVTLHRSGCPVKIAARAQRRMLNEVKKNLRMSAKDLQKSPALDHISVDKSMMRRLSFLDNTERQ